MIILQTGILQQAGINFGGGGGSGLIFSAVLWLIIIFIVTVISVAIGYFYIEKKKFNLNIIAWHMVSGRPEIIHRDKGMIQKFTGNTGASALYLKKKKKWLHEPTIMTGRNTYWFAIGQDGEWRNITLEDLDLKAEKVRIRYVDRNVRYHYTGILKNLDRRYEKVGFWEKYGGLVAYTGLILITGIMIFLLFDQFIELSSSVNGAVRTAGEVMEASRDVLGALDNVKSGGSGIVKG